MSKSAERASERARIAAKKAREAVDRYRSELAPGFLMWNNASAAGNRGNDSEYQRYPFHRHGYPRSSKGDQIGLWMNNMQFKSPAALPLHQKIRLREAKGRGINVSSTTLQLLRTMI
ncbi:hypothetical protein MUK42_28586 [Musa troglodytarum]|uniref:Uncharacterized protein n=1 Tax=Musa troglodytarum TaxID=320322 RepID=A0A9E7GE24_9LILI|nr:hypothetical protein MUK42_32917 [Musa troglodytarum]URE12944.1 hypothetical protein MUK42_28586 [Musa troglodytarum]